MKINKRIALTGLTALLSLVMTAGNIMAVCNEYSDTRPNQDPACSGWENADNGCIKITYTPSYKINKTSTHYTGLKHTGNDPTIRIVVTTTRYQCRCIVACWCAEQLGETTGDLNVQEPTYTGC